MRKIDFDAEAIVDLSEASSVTWLKSIDLGIQSGSELEIAPLASLPELTSLECGGNRVLDTSELLRFRPSVGITIKNLEHRNA